MRCDSSFCLAATLAVLMLCANSVQADWPQWGGSSSRNNVASVAGLPQSWKCGSFDRKTGAWDARGAENIRWVAKLGSQGYASPGNRSHPGLKKLVFARRRESVKPMV
jgi:hypothetical protein